MRIYHDHGKKDTGPHLLQQHVGQWLEDGVADEEDGKSGIVLTVGHMQILLKTVDFRISDVCSIQERDQVKERQPWDELEVELAKELLISSGSFFLAETSIWIWYIEQRIHNLLVSAMPVDLVLKTGAVAVFVVVNCRSHGVVLPIGVGTEAQGVILTSSAVASLSSRCASDRAKYEPRKWVESRTPRSARPAQPNIQPHLLTCVLNSHQRLGANHPEAK